ncbi:MAG: CotH kinase family protein, partial [Lachnospiraceae bacterium]|nr:CotH kinase family protein [Lachnospiraceae bacterium]
QPGTDIPVPPETDPPIPPETDPPVPPETDPPVPPETDPPIPPETDPPVPPETDPPIPPETEPPVPPETEPPAPPAADLAWYQARIGEIQAGMQAISETKTHPCIYVTTVDGQDVVSGDEYVTAVIDVFNCPEAFRLTAPAGIRVRGNSTVTEDEKPYRIKFDERQGMPGLHDGKRYQSWVLLRTFWNLAPDFMGLRLAKTIFEGKYYSSDCMFVNLYLNGVSKGIYLLCEQTQADEGRVGIYEPKKDEGQVEIGYLLEMDNYAYEEDVFFSIPAMPETMDIAGTARVIPAEDYSIKSDTRSPEQAAFISRYMNGVFRILYEAAVHNRPMTLDANLNPVDAPGYGSGFEAVNAVMDLDSLANMVILEELVQDYDVGGGSFYMAVDFSPNSIYRRLTFLAPWDFNWAYNEDPEAGYYACTFQKTVLGERSNGWYILAVKMEGFRQLVQEKWRRLYESGVLQETVNRVAADCRTLEADLGADSWKITGAESIADYVRKRISFLAAQWLGL